MTRHAGKVVAGTIGSRMPDRPAAGISQRAFFIDAHVHIHPCFDLDDCLTAAAINVRAAAEGLGVTPKAAVLLLTEQQGIDEFGRIQSNGRATRWTVDGCDALTIRLIHPEHLDIFLIAGRQIACREHLEVLALGTRSHFPDGQPIRQVLEQVEQAGALPVLPWGFGKWIGGRGKLIAELIAKPPVQDLWLGDNSGRLRHFPAPRIFAGAAESGLRMLPGSDPFPFTEQAGRVGRYGFMLDTTGGQPISGRILMQTIRDQCEQPAIYGELETFFRFVRDQVRMQLRKYS